MRLTTIYEDNYERLMALLPNVHACGEMGVGTARGAAELRVEVLGRGRYTTLLKLQQHLSELDALVSDPCMKLRVCHDAGVVEVLSYQHRNGFHLIDAAPHIARARWREKRRINEFLGEWLECCLARGMQFGWSSAEVL